MLAYWWFYFTTGVIATVVSLDAQGIRTYEPRVLVLAKAYFFMMVVVCIGHANLFAVEQRIWKNPVTRGARGAWAHAGPVLARGVRLVR